MSLFNNKLTKVQKQMLSDDVQTSLNSLGDLTTLQTTDKSNLVNAINNNTTSLAQKANQTDLNTTNQNVTSNTNTIATHTTQIAANATAITNIGNGSPKGTYATLSALQAAFSTGTTGIYIVTADGGWYYWNGTAWTKGGTYQSTGIADKSQSIGILSVSKLGKNLFDKSRVVADTRLTSNGSTMTETGASTTTYYLPVLPSTTYAFTKTYRVAWYDASYTFISWISPMGANQISVSPSNAAFMKVSVYTSDLSATQVEQNNTYTSYEDYKYIIPQAYTEKHDFNINDVPDNIFSAKKTTFARQGINIFNQATITDNYYVDSVTGNISSNTSYAASDYIPVSPNTIYTATHNRLAAFYDGNQTFISGLNDNPLVRPKTFTTPANAAYMRISVNKSTDAVSAFMVALGSSLPTYEPYGFYLDPNQVKVKKSSIYVDVANTTDTFLLFLPSEICIAVGRTIELYNSQVSWCGNINNYHFQWTCDIGHAMKRKWSCAPVSANIGNHTLTCTVYDNNMNQIAQASTTVKVVNFSISSPKKILPIGDSLTNGKGWLAEVRNLSNSQLSFVGTRWNGDVQGGYLNHEGRSGWSAANYLTNSTYTFETNGVGSENPFWNPSTSAFDYSYYKSHYGITPDVVQIYLGTNGITLDPTINANNIKAIVDGIRANDTNIHIYVVFTLFRGDQNGIGNQLSSDGYSAGSGVWKLQEDAKVYNLMVALFNALKSYTNLHFIPIALAHDSEFNFKATTSVPVNPRSTQTELEDAEATHPSARPEGYLQMADIMFSTFAAYMS